MKGKDAGKSGKVLTVLTKENKVLVEGLNLKKRHMKSKTREGKGQMVDIAHPVARANVAIVDPKSGKPTRLGAKVVGGKKIRVAKKSGQEV